MPLKIFYGVQGTGNGHISRARKMAVHFNSRNDVQVTWLFTGRDRDQLFDMECFGDFLWRRGMTFTTRHGRLQYGRTLLDAAPLQFIRDVHQLPLHDYDLVISDFEPVTAWAARRQRRPVIGIGHQYAFRHRIPEAGGDPAARAVMRWFAPVNRAIGLHWHPFGQPILPPIIDTGLVRTPGQQSYTLVYLPFEDQPSVIRMLQRLGDHAFVLYSPALEDGEDGNVSLRRTSLAGFRRDLCGASNVICNAGFELVSECLHLGHPVLVKPLERQMEQASNAAALQQLGWGRVLGSLDDAAVARWLNDIPPPPLLRYPDVAGALVDWLCNGATGDMDGLVSSLWAEVDPVAASARAD